jgi:hypothetical protein
VPGVAGDARPRRPCASQPAHFAYSHPHYHKLASNINEVKCSVQHPTSLGVRQNSSFGGGVPPGRPDASARRPYQDARRILSHTPIPSSIPSSIDFTRALGHFRAHSWVKP